MGMKPCAGWLVLVCLFFLNTPLCSHALSRLMLGLGQIGESTMVTFSPAPALRVPGAFSLDKLGSPVDPEDVQDGGNQFNHGVWSGVTITTVAGQMHIESLDAPNMNPMTPSFPFGNPFPAGSDGLKQVRPSRCWALPPSALDSPQSCSVLPSSASHGQCLWYGVSTTCAVGEVSHLQRRGPHRAVCMFARC